MTNTTTHEEVSCSVVESFESTPSDQGKTQPQPSKSKSIEKVDGQNTDSIPGEATEDDSVESNSSGFEGFGFSPQLLKTLEKKGYKEPSPIQAAAFPELMLGRDLVGQAQTGTGKTAAFALPLLERLQESGKFPQILVLAPTRELAMQVADSFKAYAAGHPHLKVLAVYGGADFRNQINTLKRGVNVVVGTPGRVMDHMRQGTLNTSELKTLVLDEADEMLRMGFIDDVEWILEQLPEDRQMVLFSATMPNEIRRLSKKYLNDPAEITIKAKTNEPRLIRQRYITLQNSYKLEILNRVLEAVTGEGVIIFARTKLITITVAESLEAAGHDVAVLNGDVPQNQRERTVERLRKGTVNVLVATDVAARGLDVDRIGLVINYDIPFDSEAYIHRIGRTGRAGRSGEAILFVNYREKRFIGTLERAVGTSIEPMEIPDNAAINKNRLERLQKRLHTWATEGREQKEETALLKQLLKQTSEELELSYEDLSLAALNLAIGSEPLLVQSDERWLKESTQRLRRKEGSLGRRNERTLRGPDENMERFRVEVGHRDRVKPGNLVGAIANESGLHGRMIGRIQIFDTFSLVDLPKGMPEDIFDCLKRLKVMNRELRIQRDSHENRQG
ncbi:DEAD/DEAH box helicase [Prochlorococcus sp. MIT 1300]|uniref:DEAD/DEAH box helicase n=1 Tax=Prochlorococcus sp. MIT 1300 TaxID=3096218 RepID=UPI002A754C69|nr:DEAD/DEAH box helicase [Prochlorococcus sp. MIT 1300]